VRAYAVVVLLPARKLLAHILQGEEHLRIQALITDTPIETLEKPFSTPEGIEGWPLFSASGSADPLIDELLELSSHSARPPSELTKFR